MNLIIKPTELDLQKAQLNLKLLFLNENTITNIRKSIGNTYKITFSPTNYEETTKANTRKRWFQVIGHILDQKDKSNENNLLRFHYDTKESIFGTVLDEDGVERVPSINSISDEMVREATDMLIEFYSRKDVDFTGII